MKEKLKKAGKIVLRVFGSVLILFGVLLIGVGISDAEVRVSIGIGIVFIVLGGLCFRNKKIKSNSAVPSQKSEEVVSERKKEEHQIIVQKEQKMAKCVRCGKGGFFHKVNRAGLCVDCERIEKLQQEETKLQSNIAKLSDDFSQTSSEYKDMKERRDKLYQEIADQARKDIEEELKKILAQINEHNKEFEQLKNKYHEQIEQLKKDIIVFDETILLESFSLYQPKFKFTSSADYKNRLDFIRDKQKDAIKNDRATTGGETITWNGSLKEGQKMMADVKKLFIRSFNNECDYCVDNVKFNNIEASEKRIEKSFEAINKCGKQNGVRLTEEYKKLKFEELYLAFEYLRKKEQEKEEAKRAREELREQQKLEREIREAREKIAKEKKHFTTAIKELEEKLQKESDEKQKALILENLEEARLKFADLGKEEKVVDYREQNAKAGYVYIISNIGAFGENVYKIGMTRRLEPMDRIDELGDASVPFSFDVHALIFSDNAPELEAKLHEHFYSNRINKINDRKEFFKADIHEIERVIKEHYKKVVDVVKEAPAEQYRESLLLN